MPLFAGDSASVAANASALVEIEAVLSHYLFSTFSIWMRLVAFGAV